jgi:hypothetical protein
MNGIAFGFGTPDTLAESYRIPGSTGDIYGQTLPPDVIARYQMLSRVKGARNASGLSQLAATQEMS